MTDEQAVREVEQLRCALVNGRRIDELAGLLADDYRHVHANGAMTGKAETLDRFRAAPRTIRRGDLLVRVWGDTAAILGPQDSLMAETTAPGRTMCGTVTQVLRRDGPAWRFVLFQLTLLGS